jgi:hypothetical protein
MSMGEQAPSGSAMQTRKVWWKRPTLVVIALLLVSLLGAAAFAGYLNVTGYCYAQSRYLSDAELMRSAIGYVISRPEKGGRSYKSIQEFQELNPDCCIVRRYDPPKSLLSTIGDSSTQFQDALLFGNYLVIADLHYRAQDEGPTPYMIEYVGVNACGQVPGRSMRTPSQHPRRIKE